MPWLDLLSEYDLHFIGVLLLDQWENRSIDCVEHLLGERANIVEVELELYIHQLAVPGALKDDLQYAKWVRKLQQISGPQTLVRAPF